MRVSTLLTTFASISKLHLLLGPVLLLGFYMFCTVFWVLLEGSNVGSEYFFNDTG